MAGVVRVLMRKQQEGHLNRACPQVTPWWGGVCEEASHLTSPGFHLLRDVQLSWVERCLELTVALVGRHILSSAALEAPGRKGFI